MDEVNAAAFPDWGAQPSPIDEPDNSSFPTSDRRALDPDCIFCTPPGGIADWDRVPSPHTFGQHRESIEATRTARAIAEAERAAAEADAAQCKAGSERAPYRDGEDAPRCDGVAYAQCYCSSHYQQVKRRKSRSVSDPSPTPLLTKEHIAARKRAALLAELAALDEEGVA